MFSVDTLAKGRHHEPCRRWRLSRSEEVRSGSTSDSSHLLEFRTRDRNVRRARRQCGKGTRGECAADHDDREGADVNHDSVVPRRDVQGIELAGRRWTNVERRIEFVWRVIQWGEGSFEVLDREYDASLHDDGAFHHGRVTNADDRTFEHHHDDARSECAGHDGCADDRVRATNDRAAGDDDHGVHDLAVWEDHLQVAAADVRNSC